MNILEYNKKKKYLNGEIISKIINDYIRLYNCENILFVRSPTTGDFLDHICINNNNVVRIIYDTDFITGINSYNLKNKIDYKNLDYTLSQLNKKFNLICIDPFHEYEISKSDFNLLYSYLSEDGTIISHDCFPANEKSARPKYLKGGWSGETYVALVEFAYNNPTLYYGLLNIDTGIGIISKLNNIIFLKNNLDIEKQKIFLSKYKNKETYIDIYKYFHENSIELINSIT
jgi:hypothetical protein